VPELTAYRCAAWHTPLWADANPGEGRYNRAGEAPTTYFGLHPLTPWAELLRRLEISDPAEASGVRPPLWVARLPLADDDVVELTFDGAESYGLTPYDLVGDDYGPCQAFASELRGDSAAPKAIVVPSAALPGTRNLVLLRERVISPLLLEPIDAAIDTPASIAAIRGRAPLNLTPLVHRRDAGAPHAALAAWEQQNAYDLTEPLLQVDELARW
jgi:RES domain-containing protein